MNKKPIFLHLQVLCTVKVLTFTLCNKIIVYIECMIIRCDNGCWSGGEEGKVHQMHYSALICVEGGGGP